MMWYSAGGVETVRLKHFHQIACGLVQKDGCGSCQAEAIIESAIPKQVPQVSPRLQSVECGLGNGEIREQEGMSILTWHTWSQCWG